MEEMSTEIDKEEAEFWFEVARQDYFFNQEREKTYYTYKKK
jgi:lipocalin